MQVWIIVPTVLIACLFWRWVCTWHSLPWPWWLAWFLENPYMKFVCNPQEIAARWQVLPGMRVLDIGCGAGRVGFYAGQAVGPQGKLVGIDMQAAMLRQFEARARRASLEQLELLHGSAHDLIPGRQIERAAMVTVLGEIPRRVELLRKIRRVMTHDGLLSITEVLPDPCYVRRSQCKKLAREAGFEVDREYVGIFSYTINFKKA